MKVSICTPVYNGVRFIVELWNNLSNQTYDNFVWVVIDDGSEDESYYILRELQKKNPNKIRLYKSKYRKEGWTHKFEYSDEDSDILVSLDIDDLLHPKALEIIVDYLSSHPDVDWIYSQSNTFWPESNTLHAFEETSYAGDYVNIHEGGFLDYNYGFGNPIDGYKNPTIGHVRAIRRKLWFDNDIHITFPLVVSDDMDMGYWLECYGNYHVLLRPLHYYRLDNNTTTRNEEIWTVDRCNKLKDFNDELFEKHLTFRKENNIGVKKPINPPTTKQHLLGLSLCFGDLQFETESQKIGLSTNYNHSLDDVNYVMKYWREHDYYTDLSECDYIIRSCYIADDSVDLDREVKFWNNLIKKYGDKKIMLCIHANIERFPDFNDLFRMAENFKSKLTKVPMWTFGAKYHFYFITINQLTVLPEKIRVPKLHNSLKIKNFLKKYNTDKNKKVYDKVYIRFDSFALGDTLAWIPYVEEFRKKHNCEVVCTTFWNNLFKEQYLDIEFEEPGSEFIISSEVPEYEIGWFYDGARNPNDVRTISLQQTASDILGLEYEEIRPKLKLGYERPIEEKYVCISVQSTAQCKYWNWPNGWQEVVDYLNEMGYKVVCIDKDKVYGNEGYWNTVPNGVVDDTGDKPLERRVQYLEHCEFFIGIGAGLSWLAWACKAKVILISSFSKPFCEFQFDCIRIYNDNEKSGYFNNKDFILDSGDWNWNPLKEIKSMEDWYDMESITPQMVKEAINMQIPPQIPFYNIEEQRYWNWDVWEQDGHEWSEQFGGTDKLWEEYIGSDIEKYLSGNVLEIACGHGRMTEKLLQNEIEYTGIDLNQNCVDRCKEIFVDYSNVNFIVNDGISLNMIGDKSIDLVFSWDSFVHMHKNVVESYFSEISRVIKDDGKILIHHANFSGGYDLSFKNWHGRANLTHQEFLTICKKYSIKIINQRPIVMKTENSSVTDMISLCGK